MTTLKQEDRISIGIFSTCVGLATLGFMYYFFLSRKQLAVWAHKPLKERLRYLPHFWTVELAAILCGSYVLIVTFTKVGTLGVFGGVRNPETGNLDSCALPCQATVAGIYNYTTFLYPSITSTPHVVARQVVAWNVYQEVLLGISRFSGFSLYPWIIMVFFTKMRGTMAFLSKTPISVYLIQDTHNLHIAAGWYILFDSLIHTLCHCLRWLDQGNLRLLWETPLGSNPSGRTGVFVLASTLIIVLPMTVIKKCINYEIRKYSHYFFWVFCICMAMHAPFWAWPNAGWCRIVFPMLMIMYLLDATYVKFFMTERINTVTYRVVDSGVELSMPVSSRFQKNLPSGGYGYVMFPWVSRNQWHAFSLYENPLDGSIRHAFMAILGDWTKEVHRLTNEAETARPLWISGPFPSPYSNALNFDNMICVASGIGITPAMSAIDAYKEYRQVNLVWACRDASMLVFFLENAKLDKKGFNVIFYTGKDPLPPTIENYNAHGVYMRIVRARPNLHYLIPNIVRNVDEIQDKMSPQYCKAMGNAQYSSEMHSPRCSEEKSAGLQDYSNLQEQEGGDVSSNQEVNGIVTSADGIHPSDVLEEQLEDSANRISVARFGVSAQADQLDWHKRLSTWTTVDDNDEINLGSFRSLIPKRHLRVWEEDKSSRDYIISKMPPSALKRWGFLYCGGRNPLLGALIKESKELGIPLHEEAFDW
ncbi:hypothetical protein ACHAW6_008629 [Cyclotella cf. meneghiniana]